VVGDWRPPETGGDKQLGDLIKHHFSRAIYRELAPLVLNEQPSSQPESNQRLVLRGCERTMDRLIRDHRHFARPARTLFDEIRVYFSIASQLYVYTVVKRNVELAVAMLARLPEEELDASGVPRQCQAMTRKGQPCQRPPLPRSDYCPSHQHLTETLGELDDLEELEGIGLAA
jgi:hypothetical protein